MFEFRHIALITSCVATEIIVLERLFPAIDDNTKFSILIVIFGLATIISFIFVIKKYYPQKLIRSR